MGRGDGTPSSQPAAPGPSAWEVHSHLLEGLLLLGRQGRQPQLCGCALPVLHLHGVCPLVVGSRGSLRTSSGPPSHGPRNAAAPDAHYDSKQPTAHRQGQTGSGTDSLAQPRCRSALARTLCLSPPGPTIKTHTKVGRHLGGPGPTWSSLRDQAAVASSGAIETGSKQQGGPALVANQTPEPQSHVALDGPGLLTPTAWCPGPHPSS